MGNHEELINKSCASAAMQTEAIFAINELGIAVHTYDKCVNVSLGELFVSEKYSDLNTRFQSICIAVLKLKTVMLEDI